MAKPEWGFKRTCLSCAAKFYDMQKDPIVCPSCGTVYNPDAATKLKRGRQQAAEEKPAEAKPEAAASEGADGDELDDELDDDDVPVVGGGGEDDDT